jgi:hypothetical protein
LAEALRPVLTDLDRTKRIVADTFKSEFRSSYNSKMRSKV